MLTAWLLDFSRPAPVLATALLALALDALFGDPAWLYRAVPHPVAALGRLIGWAEVRLNRQTGHPEVRHRLGLALVAALTLLALGLGLVLTAVFALVPGGWIAEAVLAGMLLAGRGLYDHVAAVARGLARSLPEGRAAVAHVVGRDPDSLDRAGVARATIESAAENFSDGVVAPLLFYLAFGLPGLFVYKAVNTLDSMIGHRSPRYADFGRAAARLDDGLNLLPARLAGGLLVAAALVLPSASRRPRPRGHTRGAQPLRRGRRAGGGRHRGGLASSLTGQRARAASSRRSRSRWFSKCRASASRVRSTCSSYARPLTSRSFRRLRKAWRKPSAAKRPCR
jgi:adenosylcobinamide-phosphate synthase